MAFLGAKVLHPKTMEPAREAGIEVIVRSTFNSECAGTRVCSREPGSGVRGVGIRRGISLERSLTRESGSPDSAVFRVLGSSGRGVDYLLHSESDDCAAVVCVGSVGCEELSSGISALGADGIPVRWAGPSADGLLFVVDGEDAEAALGALHGSLVAGSRSAGSYIEEGVA